MLVYVHVCEHECHDAHVEIRGQYDGVSFLSIMWVPGIELIFSGLVEGILTLGCILVTLNWSLNFNLPISLLSRFLSTDKVR